MRPYLIVIFLCGAMGIWAQDLIIYKDGRRVSCRVSAIDSASIYCRFRGSRVTGIPLSTVHKYYLSKRSEARVERGLPEGVSRDKEELFLFGGSVAYSMPVSEYASMDVNSVTSGLAMAGLALNGTVMLKVQDYLGIKVLYRNQGHQFNSQPLCAALASAYPTFTFSCDAERWRMNGVFGGLSLRFPIRSVEGLRFTVDTDIGLPRCHFPAIDYTGQSAGGYGTIKQSAPSVNTSAWSAGFGLSYRAGDQVAVAIFAEYVSATPEFEVSVYSNGNLAGRQNYQQKMTAMNVGFGLYVLPSGRK